MTRFALGFAAGAALTLAWVAGLILMDIGMSDEADEK